MDTKPGAGARAIRSPRKAMFPVMNAEKTLPSARKLMDSTAPDETVSAWSSRSRRPSSLIPAEFEVVVTAAALIVALRRDFLLLILKSVEGRHCRRRGARRRQYLASDDGLVLPQDIHRLLVQVQMGLYQFRCGQGHPLVQ